MAETVGDVKADPTSAGIANALAQPLASLLGATDPVAYYSAKDQAEAIWGAAYTSGVEVLMGAPLATPQLYPCDLVTLLATHEKILWVVEYSPLRLGRRIPLLFADEATAWTSHVSKGNALGGLLRPPYVMVAMLVPGFLVAAQLGSYFVDMDSVAEQHPDMAPLVCGLLGRLGELEALRLHAQADSSVAPFLPSLPLAELLEAPERRSELLLSWLQDTAGMSSQAAGEWAASFAAAWSAPLAARQEALSALPCGPGFTAALSALLRQRVAHPCAPDAPGGCLGAADLARLNTQLMAHHGPSQALRAAAVQTGKGLSSCSVLAGCVVMTAEVVAKAVRQLEKQLKDRTLAVVWQSEVGAWFDVVHSAALLVRLNSRVLPAGADDEMELMNELMLLLDTLQRLCAHDDMLRDLVAPVRRLSEQVDELGISVSLVSSLAGVTHAAVSALRSEFDAEVQRNQAAHQETRQAVAEVKSQQQRTSEEMASMRATMAHTMDAVQQLQVMLAQSTPSQLQAQAQQEEPELGRVPCTPRADAAAVAPKGHVGRVVSKLGSAPRGHVPTPSRTPLAALPGPRQSATRG